MTPPGSPPESCSSSIRAGWGGALPRQQHAPFLRDGDELVVERVAWEAIRVGDIVTYRLDDRFPTCRVVARLGGKLLLKADNWPASSFQVWPEDVHWPRRGAHESRAAPCTRQTHGGRLRRAWCWSEAVCSVGLRGCGLARRARSRTPDKRWIRARYGYAELPVAVQFNVSRPCNLHCRMCPYLDLHADETRTRYMSVETFERLLHLVPLVQRVHFSGSGEPTLNKDLTRFMRMVRERYPRTRIELTTNGTRLEEPLVRELIDAAGPQDPRLHRRRQPRDGPGDSPQCGLLEGQARTSSG